MDYNIRIQKNDIDISEFLLKNEQIYYETFVENNGKQNVYYDIFLTDLRILVLGENSSVSIPYSQIADIETYEGGNNLNEQFNDYREFGTGDYSIVLRMNYHFEWVFTFYLCNLERLVFYQKLISQWLK